MTPNSTYQSYLLRLWRDNPTAPWRALLQSTANGEKYHFVEVATLFEFLSACLTNDAGQPDPDDFEQKGCSGDSNVSN
jgi:hypothetical protein